MKKIKKIFRNILNWVKETPSIQPLLIIAFIFVIMFSLTFIPKGVKTVQGWFSNNYKKATELRYDATLALFDDQSGNDFILMYGTESCDHCTRFKKNTLARYLKQSNHLKVYYFDIDKAVDEDEVDSLKLEALREKMLNKDGMDYGGYSNISSSNSFNTPSIFYVVNGQTWRSHEGYMDYETFLKFLDPDEKSIVSTYITKEEFVLV